MKLNWNDRFEKLRRVEVEIKGDKYLATIINNFINADDREIRIFKNDKEIYHEFHYCTENSAKKFVNEYLSNI